MGNGGLLNAAEYASGPFLLLVNQPLCGTYASGYHAVTWMISRMLYDALVVAHRVVESTAKAYSAANFKI